jgi:hypothetical protein
MREKCPPPFASFVEIVNPFKNMLPAFVILALRVAPVATDCASAGEP